MKELIFKIPFIKKALLEAERQGGIKAFPMAQKDVLETMRDDIEEQAQERAEVLLQELLSPVDLRKVVSLDKRAGAVFLGENRADEALLHNLQSEADFLLKSEIWQLLYETPKELAQRAMFSEGDNMDAQMKKGRAILYTLSTQKNIVDILSKYKPKA